MSVRTVDWYVLTRPLLVLVFVFSLSLCASVPSMLELHMCSVVAGSLELGSSVFILISQLKECDRMWSQVDYNS